MNRVSDEEWLRRQVRDFLREFKELIGQGHFRCKGNHRKNYSFLAGLGWTERHRIDIILSLEVQDYAQGPLQDTFRAGDVLRVFGKQMEEQEFYIKLKISSPKSGGEYALCVSFHHAEYPMEHPFST